MDYFTKEDQMDEKIIVCYDENYVYTDGIFYYVRFVVDYLAQQEDGECSICGKIITDNPGGWLCMDDSSEYCNDCVEVLAREKI